MALPSDFGVRYVSISNLQAMTTPLDRLPGVLLDQILSYLSPESLIQFGMTCKRFYERSCNENLWKQIVKETLRLNSEDVLNVYREHMTYREIFLKAKIIPDMLKIVVVPFHI